MGTVLKTPVASALVLLVVAAGCGARRAWRLPDNAGGYRVTGIDGHYGPDDLHTYIDGAAEVYRAFGVRHVVARRYARGGAPDILLDLFDMGSAEGAFGAYHHDLREGPSSGIGRESNASDASLAFWKGRYFVSVLATADTPEARDGVTAIGQAVAGLIEDEGEPPALVVLLPQGRRSILSVRFVPGRALLDRYIRLSEDDLLDLDGPATGVLATVLASEAAPDDVRSVYRLLLVAYPGKDAADRALARFRERILPLAGADGIERTEALRWVAARRVGEARLAIVLDAPIREEAEFALAEVAKRAGE